MTRVAIIAALCISWAAASPLVLPEEDEWAKTHRIALPQPSEQAQEIRFRPNAWSAQAEPEESSPIDSLFAMDRSYDFKYTAHVSSSMDEQKYMQIEPNTVTSTTGFLLNCDVRLTVPAFNKAVFHVKQCRLLHPSTEEPHNLRPEQISQVTSLEQLEHDLLEAHSIEIHDKSRRLTEQLSQYPVHMTSKNGKFVLISVNSNEPIAITNLKRGMLEALQMDKNVASKIWNKEERNITASEESTQGWCTVQYQESDRQSGNIRMSSDLNQCSKSSFILTGRRECDYSRASGENFRSLCISENMPIGSFFQDAPLWSSSTIRIMRQVPQVQWIPRSSQHSEHHGPRRTTLQIEDISDVHSYDEQNQRQNAQENQRAVETIQTYLDALVKDIMQNDRVESESVELMESLVAKTRKASNLNQIAETIAAACPENANQEECTETDLIRRQLFLDALTEAQTSAALEALAHLMSSGLIEREKHEWPAYKRILRKLKQRSNEEGTSAFDLKFLAKMTQVCSQEPNRYCVMALSILANEYFEHLSNAVAYQDSAIGVRRESPIAMPQQLEQTLVFLRDLLDQQCYPTQVLMRADEPSNYNRALLALLGWNNAGRALQAMQPDFVENWIIPCIRRFTATDQRSINAGIEPAHAYHNTTWNAFMTLRKVRPSMQVMETLYELASMENQPVVVRLAGASWFTMFLARDAEFDQIGERMLHLFIDKQARRRMEPQVLSFMVSRWQVILHSQKPILIPVAQALLRLEPNLPNILRTIEHELSQLPGPLSSTFQISQYETLPLPGMHQSRIGFASDYHTMFTPNSKLPQIIAGNFTFELFDQNHDLYEFVFEFNDLESKLENLIGRQGTLSLVRVFDTIYNAIYRMLAAMDESSYNYLNREKFVQAIKLAMQEDGAVNAARRVVENLSQADMMKLAQSVMDWVSTGQPEPLAQELQKMMPRNVDLQSIIYQLNHFASKTKHIVERLMQNSYEINVSDITSICQVMQISPQICQSAVQALEQQTGASIDDIIRSMQQLNLQNLQKYVLHALRLSKMPEQAKKLFAQVMETVKSQRFSDMIERMSERVFEALEDLDIGFYLGSNDYWVFYINSRELAQFWRQQFLQGFRRMQQFAVSSTSEHAKTNWRGMFVKALTLMEPRIATPTPVGVLLSTKAKFSAIGAMRSEISYQQFAAQSNRGGNKYETTFMVEPSFTVQMTMEMAAMKIPGLLSKSIKNKMQFNHASDFGINVRADNENREMQMGIIMPSKPVTLAQIAQRLVKWEHAKAKTITKPVNWQMSQFENCFHQRLPAFIRQFVKCDWSIEMCPNVWQHYEKSAIEEYMNFVFSPKKMTLRMTPSADIAGSLVSMKVRVNIADRISHVQRNMELENVNVNEPHNIRSTSAIQIEVIQQTKEQTAQRTARNAWSAIFAEPTELDLIRADFAINQVTFESKFFLQAPSFPYKFKIFTQRKCDPTTEHQLNANQQQAACLSAVAQVLKSVTGPRDPQGARNTLVVVMQQFMQIIAKKPSGRSSGQWRPNPVTPYASNNDDYKLMLIMASDYINNFQVYLTNSFEKKVNKYTVGHKIHYDIDERMSQKLKNWLSNAFDWSGSSSAGKKQLWSQRSVNQYSGQSGNVYGLELIGQYLTILPHKYKTALNYGVLDQTRPQLVSISEKAVKAFVVLKKYDEQNQVAPLFVAISRVAIDNASDKFAKIKHEAMWASDGEMNSAKLQFELSKTQSQQSSSGAPEWHVAVNSELGQQAADAFFSLQSQPHFNDYRMRADFGFLQLTQEQMQCNRAHSALYRKVHDFDEQLARSGEQVVRSVSRCMVDRNNVAAVNSSIIVQAKLAQASTSRPSAALVDIEQVWSWKHMNSQALRQLNFVRAQIDFSSRKAMNWRVTGNANTQSSTSTDNALEADKNSARKYAFKMPSPTRQNAQIWATWVNSVSQEEGWRHDIVVEQPQSGARFRHHCAANPTEMSYSTATNISLSTVEYEMSAHVMRVQHQQCHKGLYMVAKSKAQFPDYPALSHNLQNSVEMCQRGMKVQSQFKSQLYTASSETQLNTREATYESSNTFSVHSEEQPNTYALHMSLNAPAREFEVQYEKTNPQQPETNQQMQISASAQSHQFSLTAKDPETEQELSANLQFSRRHPQLIFTVNQRNILPQAQQATLFQLEMDKVQLQRHLRSTQPSQSAIQMRMQSNQSNIRQLIRQLSQQAMKQMEENKQALMPQDVREKLWQELSAFVRDTSEAMSGYVMRAACKAAKYAQAWREQAPVNQDKCEELSAMDIAASVMQVAVRKTVNAVATVWYQVGNSLPQTPLNWLQQISQQQNPISQRIPRSLKPLTPPIAKIAQTADQLAKQWAASLYNSIEKYSGHYASVDMEKVAQGDTYHVNLLKSAVKRCMHTMRNDVSDVVEFFRRNYLSPCEWARFLNENDVLDTVKNVITESGVSAESLKQYAIDAVNERFPRNQFIQSIVQYARQSDLRQWALDMSDIIPDRFPQCGSEQWEWQNSKVEQAVAKAAEYMQEKSNMRVESAQDQVELTMPIPKAIENFDYQEITRQPLPELAQQYYNQAKQATSELIKEITQPASSSRNAARQFQPTEADSIASWLSYPKSSPNPAQKSSWWPFSSQSTASSNNVAFIWRSQSSNAFKYTQNFQGEILPFPEHALTADCEYILAQDAQTNKFSLTTNPSENILRLSVGQSVVTFQLPTPQAGSLPEPNIYFGRSQRISNLPYISDDLLVKRIGNMFEISSPQLGFALQCFPQFGQCAFNATEFYNGQMHGIFAEQRAVKQPENELNENEISRSQICHLTSEEMREEQQRLSSECSGNARTQASQMLHAMLNSPAWTHSEHFLPSPDIEKFALLDLCIAMHSSESQTLIQYSKCSWDSFFRLNAFFLQGVALAPSSLECTDCRGHAINQPFLVRPRDEHLTDVLVIVSETQSMSTVRENIKQIVEEMQNSLTSNNWSVRFGLIGFEGAGSSRMSPFSVTLGPTETYGDSARFDSAINQMQFDGQHSVDALDAIKFAMGTYQFNPLAEKIILVISENDHEKYHALANEKQIMSLLVNAGVTLNVVSDYSDVMPERDVIGMNYDGSIISTSSRHRKAHQFPRRPLARLAKITHGAIFNLNQLAQRSVQGRFTHALTTLVNQQVQFQSTMARQCQCVLPNVFDPIFITDRCHLVRA